MEQSQTHSAEEARIRLLETARSLVLRGDSAFSVNSVCAQAGVDREVFREHFSGKTALMAAVMQDQKMAPSGMAPESAKTQVVAEPAIVAPDAWLERRLRVFERALNALEAKAEATAREQARAIAELEERLKAAPVAGEAAVMSPAAEPAPENEPEPKPQTVTEAEADQDSEPVPPPAKMAEPRRVELAQQELPPAVTQALLALPPVPPAAIAKEEMADVLQTAREKARAAAEPQDAAPEINPRLRWLVMGGAALVIVFVCVGLLLGRDALGLGGNAHGGLKSDGVTHRQQAGNILTKTRALADAGNPRAQARLALAYLRGQGSAGDANAALLWTLSAAKAGNPVAEYLLGALYQQGDHVKADALTAFTWFARAAEKGNLKAMHNLAIAYAQGLGTAKDEAKAADWFTRAAEHGYVDSAFDLAVLYERGTGVRQDLKQAFKWYSVAALAGDQPSKERMDVLRTQMKAADIKLASNAATSFSPLPALEEANSL
ncbi:MAG TPA: hypothetical protein VFI23_08395 [Rhizomicrobium sp.]|nr:hypothetical protein [Rhizomicrobium sp.]